jgi:hypothetical protein
LTDRGLTGVEFKKMLPEDASSFPAIQFKSVVLPLPLGPMMACRRPGEKMAETKLMMLRGLEFMGTGIVFQNAHGAALPEK